MAITREGVVYVLYVNGKSAGSAKDPRPVLPVDHRWTISGREGFRFNGMLDELTVFDVALTGAQIRRNVPRAVPSHDKLATVWGRLKAR